MKYRSISIAFLNQVKAPEWSPMSASTVPNSNTASEAPAKKGKERGLRVWGGGGGGYYQYGMVPGTAWLAVSDLTPEFID